MSTARERAEKAWHKQYGNTARPYGNDFDYYVVGHMDAERESWPSRTGLPSGWEIVGDEPERVVQGDVWPYPCWVGYNYDVCERDTLPHIGYPVFVWRVRRVEQKPVDECRTCAKPVKGEQYCGVPYKGHGLFCTRPKGHTLNHIACVGEHHSSCSWPQEEPVKPTPPTREWLDSNRHEAWVVDRADTEIRNGEVRVWIGATPWILKPRPRCACGAWADVVHEVHNCASGCQLESEGCEVPMGHCCADFVAKPKPATRPWNFKDIEDHIGCLIRWTGRGASPLVLNQEHLNMDVGWQDYEWTPNVWPRGPWRPCTTEVKS